MFWLKATPTGNVNLNSVFSSAVLLVSMKVYWSEACADTEDGGKEGLKAAFPELLMET
jgi:hypothetical protein